MTPNALAYLSFIAFFPFAWIVFLRFSRPVAGTIVVLVGSLVLPEYFGIDLPFVPAFDKEYVTYSAALLAMVLVRKGAGRGSRSFPLELVLLLFVVLGNLATMVTNGEALLDEGVLEPGLGFGDFLSDTADDVLRCALSFYVGRSLFRTKDDLQTLLLGLAAAGFAYFALIVAEALLSIPLRVFRFSVLVYGFSPTAVSYRWGMLQPIVFLDNGLAIANFMATALVAAVWVRRARGRSLFVSGTLVWLAPLVGLVLCRNVAGVIYGATLGTLVAVASPRLIGRVAVALVLFVVGYPVLRAGGYVPVDEMVGLAREYDEARAYSLEGRFAEEEYVLNLMGDRLGFGFATISRVPGAEGLQAWREGAFEGGLDGYWIIELGIHGVLGLLSRLAFLVIPVLVAMRSIRRLPAASALGLAVLMAIVALRSVDLLPNGWWNNLHVFLAGALFGLARGMPREGEGGPNGTGKEELAPGDESATAPATPARQRPGRRWR